jgi:uncharacterized protein (TIGR00255 family)
MISSMTGYARGQVEREWGALTCELRSVNHRFLEFNFRLPEQCRAKEVVWRQFLSKNLSRGKIDVTFKFGLSNDLAAQFTVNDALVARLAQVATQFSNKFPNPQTQLMDIINWPDVLTMQEIDQGIILETAQTLLETTLMQLLEVRQKEGACLLEFFTQRLHKMHVYVNKVSERLPTLLDAMQAKIRQRFEELQLELDQTRLEQELAWLAQKADVSEEIARLLLHMREFEANINKGSVIGRRLDFLAQELNREANTLASKSIDATVTHMAVELKVLIEQIREQVQNIE